eukprot:s4178_g4.t1
MPEGDGLSSAAPVQTQPGSASHLPWHLIPSFEPGESDLTEYTKRLEFLAGIWPVEHLNQLAPRAALQCKGSAFQKVVRIQPDKLKVNDLTGVKLLVSTLGGVWGKTTLEDKYEKFERAIYGISQKSDESNESYMARHEIVFEDAISQGASLTDMRAYILLRNSALSAEDKKRVLVEAKGNLKYEAVTQAIRMLGAKFFQEVQGQQKNHRSKTYEANYVQDGDEETFFGDSLEHAFLTDGSDLPDTIVEQFLTEGDEDALVVAQFEDALIDAVQNDSEMNVFLSSYVEARRKLTEKSRSRGFWPIRSSSGFKGSGKKGKNKSFQFRSRKPLALRIAESDCRLCGQRGHWRAECPKRAQMSAAGSNQPKTSVANVMISASGVSDDEADVFLMEPTGPVLPDVHASVQDQSCHVAENSHSHVCFVSWSHKPNNRHKGEYYNQVCERLHVVFQNPAFRDSSRMSNDAECANARTTPSEKIVMKPDRMSVNRPASATSPMKVHLHVQEKNRPDVSTSYESSESHEAMFATAKTFGIVDLGASQTVMGQHQVEEFLDGLPASVRNRVFEQPVEMTFRFGNNSTVPCRKAIFVPIDRFWIKIAIVDSRTPFLISNNVCRSLGAIIDTNAQSIRFQNLDCEIPLQLSGKKLFLLDFCELAALRPPKTSEVSENSEVSADRVFLCQEQTQNHMSELKTETQSKTSAHEHVESAHMPHANIHDSNESEVSNAGQQVSQIATCSATITPSREFEAHEGTSDHHHSFLSSDKPGVSVNLDPTCSHGLQQPCRSFQCCADLESQGRKDRQVDEHELRGDGGTDHQIRRKQARPVLQTGGDRRPEILPVVHSKILCQRQGRTPGVPVLSEHVGRKEGTRDGHARSCGDTSKGQGISQGKEWTGSWEPIDKSPDLHRSGERRRHVGPNLLAGSDDRPAQCDRAAQCPSTRPDRRCAVASDGSASNPDSGCAGSECQPCVADQATTLLLDQCIAEFNQFAMNYSDQLDADEIYMMPSKNNMVLQEMLVYGQTHGFLDKNNQLVNPGKPLLDCLEIYCAEDSQLTHQCRNQNLRALRFGLKEGDLGTVSGREKLYHALYRFRPRHVWMSPRCKAWCRWNQFNASRSMQAAQRVVTARKEDAVHLQLCEAVFLHQHRMGPLYHYHLEQPVGSDMLYEDALQNITSCLARVRCDLCKAGKLVHPITGKPLQKGLQVLTSSSVMARCLEQLRCPRNHEHSQVAGNFRDSQGNLRRVSEYTELYTRTFGHKASSQLQERACYLQSNLVFHGENGDGDESQPDGPEMKRRRLNAKTSNPPAYPDPPSVEASASSSKKAEPDGSQSADFVRNILSLGSQIAPRVGKIVLERGELFETIQLAYPQYDIRVVELCKGTDRFRRPPIKLMPKEAPWRLSIGLHRHQLAPADLGQWVHWEQMSNRQMCSNSPPLRLLISIFAQLKDQSNQLDISKPVNHRPEMSVPHAKSRKLNPPDEVDSSMPPNNIDNTPTTEPIVMPTNDNITPEKSSDQVPSITTPPETSTAELDGTPTTSETKIPCTSHGPKFRALSKEVQQWISKIHHNLGHPNHLKLHNVLQQQGYSPEILQGLSDFRCNTCHEMQAPRISRPANLSDIREFNDCVGCDLITWTAKTGRSFSFLHCVDSATNFQLAVPVFRTDAQTLFDAYLSSWTQWAGPCKQLIIDNASPLCSEQFAQFMQSQDTHLRVVAAYAHWQMGKTERHGEIIQQMLAKYDHDQPIENAEDFQHALRHCCQAKNSLSRVKGYTPEILVLGKSQPLPGSLCDDVPTASQFLADSDTPEGIQFRMQLLKRECARKAFVAADNCDKLRRAFLRRQRPHRGNHMSGSFVMFWRPGKGELPGQWHGPARVIIQESSHVVWISHSSRVYRVAPEHVRTLSEREAAQYGSHLETGPIEPLPKDAGRGVFQYEDLTDVVNPVPVSETVIENQPVPPAIVNLPDPQHNQPDSEPGNPPDAVPSIAPSVEYTPTTPLSNPPNPNDVPEEPSDPKDIPVPESDGDELTVEDYWLVQNDKLIRVHQKPRVGAFDPSSTDDCPISILHVSGERFSAGNAPTQNMWSHKDRWGEKESDWQSSQPWTGVTIFQVVCEESFPINHIEDVLHLDHNQGFEYEVFFTEDDLNATAAEPETLPLLIAAAAKRQRAEVKIRDLDAAQAAEFQQAKSKELDQWLATETVRRIMRHKIPEQNILRCRWVLTWKELDEVDRAKEGRSKKAKARLVILGYEDPDLTNIPRDSPTLQKESRSLLLQLCASRQWLIQSFDIKTAFLRGSRRDNRTLGLEPPQELREKLHLRENEICELLKSAYGLVNAPYLWYQELKENLLALGFKMSPLDPCVFTLSDSSGYVHGAIGMHVDDGLCAGDQTFQAALQKLESKFPFGSKRCRDFTFTGIHIRQDDNYDIHLDQASYVQNISPIQIDRHRRKNEQEMVNESERQGLRGLIGSLQYAATNTRPDIAARLSLLQSKINCAKICDLLEANRLLGDAKKHASVTVTISSIPEDEIRMIAYSDASFATRDRQQSQKGHLILAAHQDVFQQKIALASPISWSSKKIERVVASTLAAETYALSYTVDTLNWIRLAWEWLRNPFTPWKEPEKVWTQSHPGIAVVDCKSLYDVLTKNTTPQCQEHRTLIEALVIKSHLNTGLQPHWVHSAAQLADALTKNMDSYRLREFLRHRGCCLHDVEEILKERADKKAQRNWLSNAMQSQGNSFPSLVGNNPVNSDTWDPYLSSLPADVLFHVNGNAIYNLTHPWLISMVQTLDAELVAGTLSSAFDIRMAQLTLQQYSAADPAIPYKGDSVLIGNYAQTPLRYAPHQ